MIPAFTWMDQQGARLQALRPTESPHRSVEATLPANTGSRHAGPCLAWRWWVQFFGEKAAVQAGVDEATADAGEARCSPHAATVSAATFQARGRGDDAGAAQPPGNRLLACSPGKTRSIAGSGGAPPRAFLSGSCNAGMTQCALCRWNSAISRAVTGSATAAEASATAGASWRAVSLPSSTPHWSKALMPQMQACR